MKQGLFLTFIIAITAVSSCSTTRVLQDGRYRLVENTITIKDDNKSNNKEEKFNSNILVPYIKQKAKTWSPMLCVYNWSRKDGKGWGSRFLRKIGSSPVVYEPDMVTASVGNIEHHLEYIGYYNSKVEPEIHMKRRKVKVNYLVSLGKRYPIDTVTYSIPKDNPLFAQDFIKDTSNISIKKGDYLSESILESEIERGAEYFRKIGYYSFSKKNYSFQADTISKKGVAKLYMNIREYTGNETPDDAVKFRKYKFGSVDIFYPKSLKIKNKVLVNLNAIIPGKPYSEEVVKNTYNRLSSLRMLSSVNIELTDSDTNKVNCKINLSPAELQGFKFNIEASSNSVGLLGLSPEISFYHKNIFHGGEWLNLGFMGNFQFKPNDNVRSTEFGVSSSLSFPKFVFLPYSLFKRSIPRTDIKASYNYQDRPEYKRNIISMSFGYSGVHKKLYYQLYPIQLNIVHLFNIDSKFYSSLSHNPFMRNAYQDHFDMGLGGTLYYTLNAVVIPKTSYHYAIFQFNLAGNMLSGFKSFMQQNERGERMIWQTPFSQYVRGELTLGKTWRFGKEDKYSIATRAVIGAGHAYGNSSVLPFEQHFYVGGANSMRGWQARGVGPGLSKRDTTFKIPNQSGDMRMEANLEFRFPLFWKVEGAAFVDAGNVWTLQKSTDNDNLLALISKDTLLMGIASDWGIGIRIDLSFILVRFDFGMQIYDPSENRGSRFIRPSQWLRGRSAIHFGVGYPF